MKMIFSLLCLVLLVSCSRVHLLGLQKHEFSTQPKHIVWFQIAGLSEEHVAMLRFASKPNERQTAFEGMECLGKMWSYNFYQMRPQATQGFMAQIVGKDDIKGTCSDFSHEPLWSSFDQLSYKGHILETGARFEESLARSLTCPTATNTETFLERATFWGMGKVPQNLTNKETKLFHYQDKNLEGFDRPGVFFDRSCQDGVCFSSLTENTKALFRRLTVEKKSYLFVIRDFNFEKRLKEGKIMEAREVLSELEKLVGFFKNEALSDSTMEVLVTSSASHPVEFPDQGMPWLEFENQGKNVLYKKTALSSPAFAFGAGAENFCGFFSETEVFSRLLWFRTNQDKKGLSGFWY